MKNVMTVAKLEAMSRLAAGEDPDGLCHAIDDDPERGLSSALSLENYQRGGYVSRYRTLRQWAAS